MIKHMDKHDSPTGSRRSQRAAQVKHRTLFSDSTSRQAAEQKKSRPRSWYFKGLERLVNTGDAREDYWALGKGWASFWPLPLHDGRGKDLSWSPEAHGLFLYYRDFLRRLWSRDPEATRDNGHLSLIFGTKSWAEINDIFSREPQVSHFPALQVAIAPLVNCFPKISFGSASSLYLPQAGFWLDWGAGTVTYRSTTDFQCAIWFLFRESWRAKVCPHCTSYFIATKPAQMYCSVGCSNAAHQASSLRWWREKGSRRRARAKAKKAPYGVGRKGGTR